MKNIMVVFTGGTIGSMKQGSSIDVNDAGSYMIIDLFQQQYTSSSTFNTMQPLNILSENLVADQWINLAEQLRAIDYSAIDAIILTHGSDTLAYSAAMLSYLLGDIPVPLILIASNYHLKDERANGLRNFYNAVRWIEEGASPGVFVIYENNQNESILYLGSRIMQCESFTDQFRSPYDIVLGQLEDGVVKTTSVSNRITVSDIRPAAHPYLDQIQQLDKLVTDILYVKPYPGLNYELYSWPSNRRPTAILHDLYHSGTACALTEGPYSLPQFIARCKEDNIAVYLCPVKSAEEAQYASTATLIEAGAVLLEKIGMEAALTKLIIAYSLFRSEQEVKDFMLQEQLYFERH
ncbi:asparaginase [Paenibacillus endoradicis]|uniref:asparaginase n=1 Tax=Paenibacillus endoradicis TaxID=2972487 RepID=UPI0021595BEC|nr:asparaginase [Paenibacillus endoradicis]MCR8658884.1 asparaginase [Paenibacillus endoradicis]